MMCSQCGVFIDDEEQLLHPNLCCICETVCEEMKNCHCKEINEV